MEHTGERLKQIRSELGMTQAAIADILTCRKANIAMIENGKSTLTEKNAKILVKELNINPQFLKTGSKPMFLPSPKTAKPGQETGGVPLYDLNNVKILDQLLHPAETIAPEDYIRIPNLGDCDGAVYYKGEIMHPVLRSGDMVLYKALADVGEIFWGEMYLFSVERSGGEYIHVCYLDKSENPGRAIMRGAVPVHYNTEIETSKIKAVAFVKATVRMNSSK